MNVLHPDQVVSADKNFGTFDAGIKCEFLHIDSTDACIPYDLDQCPIQFDYDAVDDLITDPPVESPNAESPPAASPPLQVDSSNAALTTTAIAAIWGMVLCFVL